MSSNIIKAKEIMERIVSKTKDNKISHKFAIVGYRDFGDAKYSN